MSDTTGIARRINRERLSQYIGKTVRFIGEIASFQDQVLTLAAPDGGSIKCEIDGEAPSCKFVEVIADVLDQASLKQTGYIFSLGNDIDLSNVNESINLSFNPLFQKYFEPCEY